MLVWILLFLLIAAVFGLGFVFKALFWVALGLFVIWLIGVLWRAIRGKK